MDPSPTLLARIAAACLGAVDVAENARTKKSNPAGAGLLVSERWRKDGGLARTLEVCC
jgi:hypothetical protein